MERNGSWWRFEVTKWQGSQRLRFDYDWGILWINIGHWQFGVRIRNVD